MKRVLLPLACAATFCFLGAGSVLSETNLELIDRAQKNLQTHVEAARKEQAAKMEEAAKENKPGEASRKYELAARFGEMPEIHAWQGAAQILAQVHDTLVSDQDDESSQTLRQLTSANLTLPTDVREDVDALAQILRKTQAEREGAYAREVAAACKRASEILVKATEPKELDKLLQELTQLAAKPPGRNRYNGGDGGPNNKLQGAVQFVNRWQDYLLARSQNNVEGQSNTLRNLADSGGYSQMLLVPRSEILARMPQKETGEGAPGGSRSAARFQAQLDADAMSILLDIKSLEEIPAALTKLTAMRKDLPAYQYRSDSNFGVALPSLQGLMRSRLELQNGLAINVSLGMNRNGDSNFQPDVENALFALRVQLVKLAIPRMLGAPEGEKPAENEGLDAYLRRMIELAKGRKDWVSVMRGLEMKNTLANSPAIPYTAGYLQELEAFKNFLAANNLEAAGQFEQAVISYLTALRSGQVELPSSVIGEHLAVIEKAHPTEYASGKEHVLNPPRSLSPYGDGFRPPVFPGMMRGGSDPRFPGGMPSAPGAPGAVNDNKLAVPAVSPSPATPVAPAVPAVPTPASTASPKAP